MLRENAIQLAGLAGIIKKTFFKLTNCFSIFLMEWNTWKPFLDLGTPKIYSGRLTIKAAPVRKHQKHFSNEKKVIMCRGSR